MRAARESNPQVRQTTTSPRVLTGVQRSTASILDPQYTLLTLLNSVSTATRCSVYATQNDALDPNYVEFFRGRVEDAHQL